MIPKVIHYCWFGGQPLPGLAQKCVASWRKYCPDYEIREWNEGNYDIKNTCDYVREAYGKKMWAFVSDYARFDILYRYGGVYFDTDVELIRPIDDILEKGPFLGLESGVQKEMPNPGLGIAATAGMEIYREALDYYAKSHFGADEKGDYKTVVSISDEIFSRHGEILQGQISQIAGVTIYPPEYFCPLSYVTGQLVITENTRSIHHFNASWVSKESRKIMEIKKRVAGKGRIAHVAASVQIRLLVFADVAKKRGIGKAVSMTFQYIGKMLGGGLNEALAYDASLAMCGGAA